MQWNLNENINILINKSQFENVVYCMFAISPGPHMIQLLVNRLRPSDAYTSIIYY